MLELLAFTAKPSSPTATSITTGSIGIAIVGGTKQLTWAISPPDATITDKTFSSSNTSIMTVDGNGLMSFISEGGFDVTMSAKNNLGTTLSDSSGGYASVLSVYTDSLNAMDVGTTQQLVATISPSGAETLPDMVITYTTTDSTVATVDSNGVITGIGDGGCRIGCTATYQGVVVASDSSYLSVNAVAEGIVSPDPATSLTILNGYFNQPTGGVLTFPKFSGAVIASNLSNYVVKINGAIIPTANLTISGNAVQTKQSYGAGNYRLYIERASSSIATNPILMSQSSALLELWDGNNIGYASSPASEFLSGCVNLRKITSNCFGNTAYTGTSLPNLLSGCTSLTEIPTGLLKPANFANVTTVTGLAANCTALITVPSDLFNNLPKVTRYQNIFNGCTSLANIPAGMFDNVPTGVTSMSGLFGNCTSLVDFNTLFANSPGLTTLGKRGALNTFFTGCTNLVGQGVPLTSSLGGATNAGLFRNCTKLSDYASIPSGYK